jgi:ubiquinone/menaquinone biosynthesis C-methylase UbiE
MLQQARAKDDTLHVATADLVRLPLSDESVDLAVCSLALSHCEDLRTPVAELSRVVRPGGRVVVSDIHPLALLLGGRALAITADGSAALIPDFVHSIQDYLEAFREAELEVIRCLEPTYDQRAVDSFPGASVAPDAFLAAYVGLPAALVWELKQLER